MFKGLFKALCTTHSNSCQYPLINYLTQKEKLQDESLDELRKLLRERKKKLQSIPNFNLKTKGHDASLEIPEDLRTSLLMRDLQSLLLYALMGTQAPVEPSRWCKFEQWNKLTHVNCLAIEGAVSNSDNFLVSICILCYPCFWVFFEKVILNYSKDIID